MNIAKRLLWLLIVGLFKNSFANIHLFQTEDTVSTQAFDCIYYTNVTAANNESTPYCIRTNESIPINRSFTTNRCENSGKEWSFKVLKDMQVSQDEVLTWNSSLEMADRYASYLINGYVKPRIKQIADDHPSVHWSIIRKY